MTNVNRRRMIKTAGATTAFFAMSKVRNLSSFAAAPQAQGDSLPMQLYKSLSDEQREKICLPIDHKSRTFISNWWYVHRDHRIHNTFSPEQQELIQQIFDSFHSPEHQEAVNKQVLIDQYGQPENTPAVGFFGSPKDKDFEFIYTGHHVTRRCNAHFDKGQGFGGAPIFYGHFPEDFNETKDHPGNPYWYQGKIFNRFVKSLSGQQQRMALASEPPRSERPDRVIKKRTEGWPGLPCSELSEDQQTLLVETMREMLSMFRPDDVTATLDAIKKKQMVDDLYVSYYAGKYDIGSDKVWDTWQIEGPNMVWYFRGQPHIHSYFHLKS